MSAAPAVTTGALKPIQVGEVVCCPIPDGAFDYPREAVLPPEMEASRMEQFPRTLLVPYTPLLVISGGLRVLIDTGAGSLAPPSTGRLRASLATAGFQPEEIDLVMLSHGHPDHIGGLLTEDGEPMFPNARILMSHQEYQLWHSKEMLNRLGTGSVYGNPEIETLMKAWTARYLTPLTRRLEWVDNGAEIAPGMVTFSAPGHTPAHLGVTIHSGSEMLLYMGDTFALPEHIAHPEMTSSFDLDRPQTVATRGKLLDRAASEHSRVYHYHFSRVGEIVRRADSFAWEPCLD